MHDSEMPFLGDHTKIKYNNTEDCFPKVTNSHYQKESPRIYLL